MNYYEILGVSRHATLKELTDAKNLLAKKYHPDVTQKSGIDTTEKMQEILEAYTLLSDPESRKEYDQVTFGVQRIYQTFDLHQMKDASCEDCYPTFLTYWKAAERLNDLITESLPLYGKRQYRSVLDRLSKEAYDCTQTLKNAEIPEKYWHPESMNWLLYTWNKNRNFNTAYLLKLYDNHIKHKKNGAARLVIYSRQRNYQRQVRRLIRRS